MNTQWELTDYLRFPIKKHVTSTGLILLYFENSSAGGEIHNASIIDIIKKTGKEHYIRAHEWCCGHGAIGFEILSQKLCDSLCLSDKFLPAIVGCEFTSACNNLTINTAIYQIKEFSNFPAEEMWDLVVADPPHFGSVDDINPQWGEDAIRQVIDDGWTSHRIFFESIKQHLLPNADVYLYEGYCGSTPKTFEKMIASSGLKLVDIYNIPELPFNYILHLKN